MNDHDDPTTPTDDAVITRLRSALDEAAAGIELDGCRPLPLPSDHAVVQALGRRCRGHRAAGRWRRVGTEHPSDR